MLPINMPDLELTKWRNRVTHILIILVFVITLLELISVSIRLLGGWGENGANEYFRSRVLIPCLVNGSLIFLNYRVQVHSAIRESYKDMILIVICNLMCVTAVYTYSGLVTILTMFCFPVLISALFASRKKLQFSVALGFVLMTVCAVYLFYQSPKSTSWNENVAVSYIAFLACILLSNILITYIAEKKAYISSSYQIQRILDQKIKIDPLTNLYNQRTFFHKLTECIHLAQQKDIVFSIAVLDIDDFKSINDTYGHSAGNEVLEGLSDLMGMVFSLDSEFVARYGGEEFGIIFKNMTEEEAYERIEQLRRHFFHDSHSRIGVKHITFSGGIAEYRPGDESITLFNRADAALYQAKNRGKNQTAKALCSD